MDKIKHKITLGHTGIALSPLGLGTVKFGRNEGVKYPAAFDLPDEAALADLLALAQDLGVNFLDTAPAYGVSEERLGRLLKGQREDWVIVGKAGEEFEGGVSSYDFSPAHFKASLERSLKRLQTDYIDVFLIHSDGNDEAALSDEIISVMQRFKDAGLVRAIGASTKSVEGGLKALEAMDVVMVNYSAGYRDEAAVLDRAAILGKAVLLKKVLSSGHDTDVEAVLRFALRHPCHPAAVIGTINPVHLRENLEAALRALL